MVARVPAVGALGALGGARLELPPGDSRGRASTTGWSAAPSATRPPGSTSCSTCRTCTTRAGPSYLEDGILEVSPDGRWLAWSVDLEGDEVYALRFRDLATGRDLEEVVPRTYYGGAWSADSGSFLYTVHDESYRPFQVWRHVLGTSGRRGRAGARGPRRPARARAGRRRGRAGGSSITLAGRGFTEEWLVPAADVTRPPVRVRPREVGRRVRPRARAGHGPSGGDGFYVTTNLGATEFQVMWAPEDDPSAWVPLLPEDPAVRVWGVDAFADGQVLSPAP